MITEDFIRRTKTKWSITDINVLREYVQHNFLADLYTKKQANKFFFKGGFALRDASRSPKFSEDLNFSPEIDSVKKIEQIIKEVLMHLQYQAISVDFSEVKATAGGYYF